MKNQTWRICEDKETTEPWALINNTSASLAASHLGISKQFMYSNELRLTTKVTVHLLFPRQSLFPVRDVVQRILMAFCICLEFWMHSSPAGAVALTKLLYIQKPDMSTLHVQGALLPFVAWRPSVPHMQGMSEVSRQINRATSFVRGWINKFSQGEQRMVYWFLSLIVFT